MKWFTRKRGWEILFLLNKSSWRLYFLFNPRIVHPNIRIIWTTSTCYKITTKVLFTFPSNKNIIIKASKLVFSQLFVQYLIWRPRMLDTNNLYGVSQGSRGKTNSCFHDLTQAFFLAFWGTREVCKMSFPLIFCTFIQGLKSDNIEHYHSLPPPCSNKSYYCLFQLQVIAEPQKCSVQSGQHSSGFYGWPKSFQNKEFLPTWKFSPLHTFFYCPSMLLWFGFFWGEIK